MTEVHKSEEHHVCLVWVGYLLTSPTRRLLQNPHRILGAYVTRGMSVLDIGCGMGFFSLPMARLVGQHGRVICVDLQQEMLNALLRRAHRANLHDRIEARLCGPDSLGICDLADKIDFALAFAVVHEVPSPLRLFQEIHNAVKPGGHVLVAEPKGRVSKLSFQESIEAAEISGFRVVKHPKISRSNAVVLEHTACEPTPVE